MRIIEAYRPLRKIFLAFLLSIGIFTATAASHQWAPLRVDTAGSKEIVADEEIQIHTLPSTIILHLSQTSKVEIFTILGRVVNLETLPAGSYEFHADTHGIYIVKIGDLTCKVAL